jgi:hypothetical protein
MRIGAPAAFVAIICRFVILLDATLFARTSSFYDDLQRPTVPAVGADHFHRLDEFCPGFAISVSDR